jgi:hypothetical protein
MYAFLFTCEWGRERETRHAMERHVRPYDSACFVVAGTTVVEAQRRTAVAAAVVVVVVVVPAAHGAQARSSQMQT